MRGGNDRLSTWEFGRVNRPLKAETRVRSRRGHRHLPRRCATADVQLISATCRSCTAAMPCPSRPYCPIAGSSGRVRALNRRPGRSRQPPAGRHIISSPGTPHTVRRSRMRALMALLTVVLLLSPFTAHAQDRAALRRPSRRWGHRTQVDRDPGGGHLLLGRAEPDAGHGLAPVHRAEPQAPRELRDRLPPRRHDENAHPGTAPGRWPLRPRGAHRGRGRQRRPRLERGRRERRPGAHRAGRPTAAALVDAPRGHQGRPEEPRRGPGPYDRVRRPWPVQGHRVPRHGQPRRARRGGAGEPRAGRHARDGPLRGLSRLRRREVPHEDPADLRWLTRRWSSR